jgi:hypothetical protein
MLHHSAMYETVLEECICVHDICSYIAKLAILNLFSYRPKNKHHLLLTVGDNDVALLGRYETGLEECICVHDMCSYIAKWAILNLFSYQPNDAISSSSA